MPEMYYHRLQNFILLTYNAEGFKGSFINPMF